MIRNKEKIFFVGYILISIVASLFLAKNDMILLFVGVMIGIPIIIFCLKKPVRLIYFQIIYSLFIKFLISDIGVPNIANYVTDLINILLLFFAVRKYIMDKPKLNIRNIAIVVILMLIVSVFSFILNFSKITLYVWALRNLYRFFAFMFSCIVLLKKEDLKTIFKIFEIVFWLNVILCTYQKFILNLFQDFIAGFFGTISGGNAAMNMLMIIVFSEKAIKFVNKDCSLHNFIFYMTATAYIAAISELKVYYIEMLIIILISVLISRKNIRTFIISIVSVLILILTINILYTLYPGFRNFFNMEEILDYSSNGGYSNENDLNRFTAIQTLRDKYMEKNQMFLGIGTGNAEVSQFSAFCSNFYNQYYYLNYNWFSYAFIFLENGYIGLALYMLFFIVNIILMFKFMKKSEQKEYYILGIILNIISLLLMVYNSSLRGDTAYIWFCALAFPYIYNKKEIKYNEEEQQHKSECYYSNL